MEIPIIFEDEDIRVIDKPAGITVNRAETTKGQMTVQEWAEEKLRIKNLELRIKEEEEKRKEGEYGNDFYKRGGVVHRLDKETSGVLILAKNPEAFLNLQTQFRERTVKKVYQALAHGVIEPSEGEINVPVGRLPWNRNRFGILPEGRESKTLYKVVKVYQNLQTGERLSFVELYPYSGRTHQIRVHLKYINRPIFSDFLYAGRKTARNDRKFLPRVFLHAVKISFQHPTTGEMLTFEAPLPRELREVLFSLSEA